MSDPIKHSAESQYMRTEILQILNTLVSRHGESSAIPLIQLIRDLGEIREKVGWSNIREIRKLDLLLENLMNLSEENMGRLVDEIDQQDFVRKMKEMSPEEHEQIIQAEFHPSASEAISSPVPGKKYDFEEATDQETVIWAAWHFTETYDQDDFTTGDISETLEEFLPDHTINVSRTLQLMSEKRNGFIEESGTYGKGTVRKRKIFKVTKAGQIKGAEVDQNRAVQVS